LTSSFLLKSVFAAALFILLFISAITYKHSLEISESTDLLVTSYQTSVELEQLFSFVKDAETGQRGFIITGDSIFLEPYVNARDKINRSFANLKKLTANNLKQQNNLNALYHLINQRFLFFSLVIKQYDTKPFDKAALNKPMLMGKNVMDLIRIEITRMIKLEKVYLKERQQKYEREISFTPLFTLVILIFVLLTFAFSYWKINTDLQSLREINSNLLITTESISHAEEIGAFSTWQWDIKTNKLRYSDNQYRLLGCEPNSFEPTVESFLQFVHPKDRHIITEGNNKVINENKYPGAFFRVIRKGGQVRYFESLSKRIIDPQNKKILIGINRDITEQHLSNISLADRNRELELSNKELTAFNHVASHDLQEPLRIIQTFISRIFTKENESMSAASKEYLERIKAAAMRMRILIDDLLLFSRTNITNKVFEKADLNQILEDSKQDLAQIISEKNAVFEDTVLPELNVIPFQIQQLFTNFIGNSLKYARVGVAPVIKFECEKIIAKDQLELNSDSRKEYYKISITDNGMGFEQQYAEKIFIPFQRLHTDLEFPGTGIGLAICKKIVENHHGYIFAYGNPNAGAAFTIFLPIII